MLEIPGLQYVPNYLTVEQQEYYIAEIDRQLWLTDLSRRVQHYGYAYSYKNRSLDSSMKLRPLPDWAKELAQNLYQNQKVPCLPNQVIVNEYLPGQGIAHHIDCSNCFGDTIVSISLASPCVMELISSKKEKRIIFLEPRSLLIFSGEARFEWKHGISKRKTDLINGNRITRKRRLSITFRTVKLTE